MKKITIGLSIMVSCLAFLLISGCTTSQQRAAFNTIATVQVVTVGAYDGYLSGVVSGAFPTNDVPKVSQKFNVFQAATLVALDAVEYNTNAIAPPYLSLVSTDLLNLINTISPR